MGSWNDVLNEVNVAGSNFDIVRRKYAAKLNEVTGRNVILYYSGWLQKERLAKEGSTAISINDADKNGFMTAIHTLDRSKGLDLVLHTPGGDIAATESLVHYLRSMFGTDIRVIVPQLAMSCGTMIALSAKQIVMGQHSSLGPIDPQFGGISAHGIIEEFEKAKEEILRDPKTIPIWQPIIAKYRPALIGDSEKAIAWSKEITTDWLKTGMFASDTDKEAKSKKIVDDLADHILTKNHARHIALEKIESLGLAVLRLESDPKLQEAVLDLHHACTITLAGTGAVKMIENHIGAAYFEMVQAVVVQQQPM